jgi:DNA repair photolyase
MPDQIDGFQAETSTNLLKFPLERIQAFTKIIPPTPVYDELIKDSEKLNRISKYPCSFDYTIYRDMELRYKDKPIHGGIYKSNPMKLVNAHSSCQQCLYSFEIDSYGRGCMHNCVYCYAKAELTVRGYWNNPIPVPININELRRVFYTVFETDKPSKWREIISKRIPLRIGAMSDSFMWMDQKYKVTQELLRILSYYDYPYVVITRSDLAAHDDYLALMRKDLASIQFSMASTNDSLNKLIEPGAPSAKRRLVALEKIVKSGFWTTVRINPVFPIYPDGYFTDPNFKWEGSVPKFDYSSFEMVDEIADAGVSSIMAGFGRFSGFALNNIEKSAGINLRPFFDRSKVNKSQRDFHFSDREIRYYYEEFKRRCVKRAAEFTVCYIGNGENQFWDTRDLWSNKGDCCNIKGKVAAFKTDAREIPFATRLKFTTFKETVGSARLHEPLEQSNEAVIPVIESRLDLQ